MISRVKGHGKRATYILRPPLVHGWHVKLRPIAERQVLLDEVARLRLIRNKLPSTKIIQSADIEDMPFDSPEWANGKSRRVSQRL